MVEKLDNYQGSWRRSEIIRTTKHGNILMSDYGHHPSEIIPTLRAIKGKYPEKKLYVVFQPHQYSRTRELLDEFSSAFGSADILVIPNIYFSRDKQEDVEWMTTEKLIAHIAKHQPSVINGLGLENTARLIEEYNTKNPNSSVILLLGAGDVDNLRYSVI
jgi:UDP-N-acetylmuramate--alanine ligase